MAAQPLISQQPISKTSFNPTKKGYEHKDGKCCEMGDTLATGCFCLTCVTMLPVCSSILSVQQQTEKLIFRWGKYESTLTEPGLYWNNCFGREVRNVATTIQSMELPSRSSRSTTVLDANGNPLVVSGVVVYQVDDTYKASVTTQNYIQFIETQGESVLKTVVGRFPYESTTGAPCLQRNSDVVCEALYAELQQQLYVAGVKVHSFSLKEISYAPVIAAAMLKRQQAQAMVEARQTIVAGAVDTTTGAIDALKKRGISLDESATQTLVSNLLTVICSETDVQPTLPLTGGK